MQSTQHHFLSSDIQVIGELQDSAVEAAAGLQMGDNNLLGCIHTCRCELEKKRDVILITRDAAVGFCCGTWLFVLVVQLC